MGRSDFVLQQKACDISTETEVGLLTSGVVEQELYSEPEFDEEQVGDDDGGLLISGVVDPEPFVSNQFYTFNRASHHLMVQCILAGRYAFPDEIKGATPISILSSWRSVWKDRHQDTAYLTGWKRIQDKLNAQVDNGVELLFFKNNAQQFVPHVEQWQEIVQGFHADADLKHLGMKDTIERIKQVWTVGAKFYGIPESYVRVCVNTCPVCNSYRDSNGLNNKRRRFEYTESFEVVAKDVPQKLQQLAAKHKVILCIRQKYIRYKPFLAEVKDYCCHRAGEPTIRKAASKKKNTFTSSRCGCTFRIRAIVPINNYSYKNKTFSYLEDGLATFKLFAVHSGHDPAPHEGGGMVINRVLDPTCLSEEPGEAAEAHGAVLQQMSELRAELAQLEGSIPELPLDSLSNISQELVSTNLKLKNLLPGEKDVLAAGDMEMVSSGDVHAKDVEYGIWEDFNRGKQIADLSVENSRYDTKSGSTAHHQKRRTGRPSRKCENKEPRLLVSGNEGCSKFGGRMVDAHCSTGVHDKSCSPVNVAIEESLVNMHESYYPESDKWYEGVSCNLDQSPGCGEDLSHNVHTGFRHAIS